MSGDIKQGRVVFSFKRQSRKRYEMRPNSKVTINDLYEVAYAISIDTWDDLDLL